MVDLEEAGQVEPHSGAGGGYVGGDASQDYTNEGGHGGSSRNNGSLIEFGNHSTIIVQ